MFIFISFRLKPHSKNRQSFSVALSLAVATNTKSPHRELQAHHLKRAIRTEISWDSETAVAAACGAAVPKGMPGSQDSPRCPWASVRLAPVRANPIQLAVGIHYLEGT